MEVWFVDDREDNHRAWLASFPASVHAECSLRVFPSVPACFAALDAGERPDVVFVDFFIEGHYGTEVIDRFLEGDLPTPLIIAHSSMGRANEGMVREGAHLAMEKHKGDASTRSIEQAIRGPEDLRRMIRDHQG